MRIVVIKSNVTNRIKEYAQSILFPNDYTFKVDEKRALEKWNEIIDALKKDLCKDLNRYPPTTHSQLGKDKGYHQYTYTMKGTKTTFCFGIEEDDETVIVHYMENSKLLKDHKEYYRNLIIENNNQNKTRKTMNRIRLTESQLHNVIKKCVNEAIEEVYDNGNWFETNDGQKGFIVGQGNDSSVDVMIDGDKNVTRNMPWNKLKSTGASKPRYNQYAKFMTSQQGKDYITRDKGWNEDDYNSHINHYNLKQYANESLERIVKQIVLEELNNH